MEHNCRTVIHKLIDRLREPHGGGSAENLLKELDRLDQCKQGITEEKCSDLAEDVAQFFPSEYADVPEAAALVAHVKMKREKAKGGKEDGNRVDSE